MKPSVILAHGDMLDILPRLPANSVDSVVCDPPYNLTSITKRFGKDGAAACKHGSDGAFARASRGFLGKEWDSDIAFQVKTWIEVYRVLKPGAHLAAFGGTRTFHRMMTAIEDAGFEMRDTYMWVYAQGMPKSHDVERAVAAVTCVQPGRHCRSSLPSPSSAGDHICPTTPESEPWAGFGSSVKPAWEPIAIFRKPLEGAMAENILKWGAGGINIDGCRIEGRERTDYGLTTAKRTTRNVYGKASPSADFDSSKGRFPANLVVDGSDEVTAMFPDSAARFFYRAKANAEDRNGSKHPTVKPVALIRYLCRLLTPPGGTVLDPFAGSGTTGAAAVAEGMSSLLCEREQEYVDDIRRRLPQATLVVVGPRAVS